MDRPPVRIDRRSIREALFERALRLDPPWKITRIEFREVEEVIKAFIDFPEGAFSAVPFAASLSRLTTRQRRNGAAR
jgi:hypothetical protein